jgi:hypothetical protein
MSNKTLIPLIIVLSLITIGVASLTQLNKAPEKLGVNPSSEVVSSFKTQVFSGSSSKSEISISQISARSQTMDSAIQELFKYTISGNLNGNIPILLNINSESEAEYEYNGVSQTPIPLKILNDSKDLVLQENNNTYFRLDYMTLQGTWTDGKNTYPATLFKTDRLSLQDIIKSNKAVLSAVKSGKRDSVPTFDSRSQTSLKLETPNEITSINIGKCDLQTKFQTGWCEILDQNNKVIFLFNSWTGIPLLIDSTKESKTILNISQPYIACSVSKYEFSYNKKVLNTVLKLTSLDCKDDNIISEIKKYESEYNKLNNF